MTFNQATWILVSWVFAYYMLARSVLAKINRDDPDNFDLGTNGKLPFGIATSFAIWDMVWDTDLPGTEFGNFVRRGLYAVRVLAGLYIPAAITLLCCVDWDAT
ncbi:hypothetical protein ACXU4B_11040 [Dyella soli]|uniref:MAPEG family protein n=1 Tax=Dyella soli TaxID=522319 RepID=A0A4R0YLV1_9GAMM|nr:hypothetical protein [Dyella soli]TCI07295.1 hypothetical protein EZM97_32380 [Dyella soli]